MLVRITIANSLIFFITSSLIELLNFSDPIIIVLPNIIFFILSSFVWVGFGLSGKFLDPFCWFSLGCGLFFGLGGFVSGLQLDLWHVYVNGGSIQYIKSVNLMNSVSFLLVSIVWLLIMKRSIMRPLVKVDITNPIPIARICLILVLLMIAIKIFNFPLAPNLIARSIIDKLDVFWISSFFISGMVYFSVPRSYQIAIVIAVLISVFFGMLLFSKAALLIPIVAVAVGCICQRAELRSIGFLLIGSSLIFLLANPLVSMGRLHEMYDPSVNTLEDRINIFYETVSRPSIDQTLEVGAAVGVAGEDLSRTSPKSYIPAFLKRFDVVSVQGFLISEYDKGRPGKSLSDVFWILIPRIVWTDKPLMTSHGNELSGLYFRDPGLKSSALAPGYTGEAYWNFGWLGLIFISVYMGMLLGVCGRAAEAMLNSNRKSYLLVAFPLILTFIQVESWVVPSFFAGIVILGVWYFIAYFVERFFEGRTDVEKNPK